LGKNSISEIIRKTIRVIICRISGYNKRRVLNNYSIFTCEFTKRHFEKFYGPVEGEIIYPPLIVNCTEIKEFSSREDGFIYSGRVASDKNVHLIIEFIRDLRAICHDVHLHIIGPVTDEKYGKKLRRKYKFDWLHFEGSKTREQLCEFLTKHKYAIQGRQYEPFGMSAGESCRLGCLTFVPKTSGFAELLDNELLKFSCFSELLEKFISLHGDTYIQSQISQHLIKKFSSFTKESFQRRITDTFIDASKTIS
jgi:glycosyltransferase involved in cell wall biosynthesis